MPTRQIQLIDDDKNVRSSLAAILLQAGYLVASVGFIGDVIKNMMPECYDMVLLDLKMPEMEGLALLTKIETVYPKLPVVILSDDSSHLFDKGTEYRTVRACFIKPIDPVLLLDRVKEIFSEPSVQEN